MQRYLDSERILSFLDKVEEFNWQYASDRIPHKPDVDRQNQRKLRALDRALDNLLLKIYADWQEAQKIQNGVTNLKPHQVRNFDRDATSRLTRAMTTFVSEMKTFRKFADQNFTKSNLLRTKDGGIFGARLAASPKYLRGLSYQHIHTCDPK